MHRDQFDLVARSLARSSSRRVVARLAAMLLPLAGLAGSLDATEGAKRKKRKRRGKPQQHGARLQADKKKKKKCKAPKIKCGKACLDPRTDRGNCGSCGKVCAAGQSCVSGTCTGGAATCGNAPCSNGERCIENVCCPSAQQCGSVCCKANANCNAGECVPKGVKFTLINEWQGDGSVEGKFLNPVGIALDSAGNVYVADTGNNRIQKFDRDGVYITKWGSPEVQFNQPTGIAVDSEGNFFVADYGNHLVKKFDKDGIFQEKWGRDYNGPDFSNPFGVALTSNGSVAITAAGSHQVLVIPMFGGYVEAWGSPGSGDSEFNQLRGIAVDRQNKVYVANESSFVADPPEVKKFWQVGTFITSWGSLGSDPGSFRSVSGIAVDAEDSVYVTDPQFGRIQKFTNTGKYLIGSAGDSTGSGPDGTFEDPTGIAVAPDGTTYVVDSARNTVLVFRQEQV